MYTQFSIVKGAGKARIITAPDERLKLLQRKLALLLDQLYRVRNPVHGFVKNRSVKSNAESHSKRRYVVNIDLSDFFPSITENRVRGLLRALGLDIRVSDIIARISCFEGHLPQGAPTSPVISNMICYRLDTALLKFAKNTRSIYTRYADDITFSTFQPPTALFSGGVPASGRFAPEILATELINAIKSNGFVINAEKSHYADKHARRIVTGLKINELINVDRRFVRNLRAAIHSIEQTGLVIAQAKFDAKFGSGKSLKSHLAGKVSWLAFIKGQTDPLVRSIVLRFNRCFPDSTLKVEMTESEKLYRSVWVVEHEGELGTQGTCFFLQDVGLVTAAHCVQNIDNVEIYHPSKPSNKFGAKVVRRHEHRDLALLEPTLPETEYFSLLCAESIVGVEAPTTALGYPGYGPGDKLNIRSGTVSSLPTKQGVQYIEVTQKIGPGMSGGPLVDSSQHVIGINHKGGPEMARDYAVSIVELKAWLLE